MLLMLLMLMLMLALTLLAVAVAKRGLKAVDIARKRGLQIPPEIAAALDSDAASAPAPASAPSSVPDPQDDVKTLIITHPLCLEHKTCPTLAREGDRPPEVCAVYLRAHTGTYTSTAKDACTHARAHAHARTRTYKERRSPACAV